ncbi:cytochrome P450 2J6-like [Patella vulgata]|uniref:cytochrome P450 2J6-like n=1 Tax=Patella vulgata TaxID=6465 RepID=UPI0024A805F7|nr:cytochrome P450 2J6-like [Patella vulgata]
MDVLNMFSDLTPYTLLLGLVMVLLIAVIMSQQEQPGIPPGPSAWPVVGNVFDMGGKYKGKRHKYFDDMRKKYGSIYRFYFGNQLYVVLNDADSIEEAFVKHKSEFSNRPVDAFWIVRESNKSGTGIIWSNDDEWKVKRELALQILGESNLEDMVRAETKVVLDVLSQSDGKPLASQGLFLNATVNIISRILLGSRFDDNDPDFLRIIDVVSTSFTNEGTFSMLNVFPKLRFLPFIASKLRVLFDKVGKVRNYLSGQISEHKKQYTKDKLNDLIDVYLSKNGHDDGMKLVSEGDLVKLILELFPAASVTTMISLNWALLYMILHPEIQKKCQDEIGSVVGTNRMVHWSDRSKLPYTQATLLEIQRVASVTATSIPHTPTKDVVLSGFLIPKDCVVLANLYSCHFDEQIWDEPLVFKPERFLNDARNPTKPPAFMPFSTGPRRCPGESLVVLELFVFFTNILQKFSLTGSGELSTDGNYAIFLSPPPFLIHAKGRQ